MSLSIFTSSLFTFHSSLETCRFFSSFLVYFAIFLISAWKLARFFIAIKCQLWYNNSDPCCYLSRQWSSFVRKTKRRVPHRKAWHSFFYFCFLSFYNIYYVNCGRIHIFSGRYICVILSRYNNWICRLGLVRLMGADQTNLIERVHSSMSAA